MRRSILRALCLVGLLQACSPVLSAAADRIKGVYVGHTPSPLSVSLDDARIAAQEEASRTQGAVVVRGCGSSMQPLYQAGALLVVAPVRYEDLKAGATVLYYNRAGRPVTHVLVSNGRSGWRAVGLNNEREDAEPVTPSNLAGIVTHAFQPVVKTPARLARL